MLQRRAIDDGLDMLGDDEGVVNVYGSNEQPLRDGERLCASPSANERVVFHPQAIALTTGGHACPECGSTSGVHDGTS